MADLPDTLIALQRTARARLAGLTGDEYDAQWRAWRKAAAEFQAAVTDYAGREDVTESRYDIEQAVKTAVRHATEDPAE
ncbi:hypothetical protein AB0P02_01140 [Streptomyces griseoluteus]|uniref:hypothetical protein n=1 Tax=Streptomyces griseoluteus TaxID=29306 RepID=UPI0034149DFA